MTVKRLLVVEADAVQRVRIQTILMQAGYLADAALDPAHGVELAEIRNYALVLAASRIPQLSAVPILEIDGGTDVLAAVAERLGLPELREAPLVDRDRLGRLRADMSTEAFREALSNYLRGGRGHLARINETLARDELRTVAAEAHALNGTSGTFGALRLRDAAAAFEKVAKANDLPATREALPALSRVSEETWPLFELELGTI